MEIKKSSKGVIAICITIFLSLMANALLLGFILVHFNTENVETRTNYKTAEELYKEYKEALATKQILYGLNNDDGEMSTSSDSTSSDSDYTWRYGIDSVSTQEFASYDNTKVSGTQVTTALSMFQGRDVAIVIQTEAFRQLGSDLAINYGAIVTSDGRSSNSENLPGLYADTNKGNVIGNLDTVKNEFITQQAKTAYVVKYVDGINEEEASIWRESGSPNYTAYLHNTNGLVDSSYDTIGTTELGNAAYISSSDRFSSVLIKDPTGSIIGILFKQIQE